MDLIYLHPKTYLSGSWNPKYNFQLLFMKDKYLFLHCTLSKWLNLIVLVVERHILGHDSHDLWVHVRLQNPANIIIKSHIFSMHMGHFPVCKSSSWAIVRNTHIWWTYPESVFVEYVTSPTKNSHARQYHECQKPCKPWWISPCVINRWDHDQMTGIQAVIPLRSH